MLIALTSAFALSLLMPADGFAAELEDKLVMAIIERNAEQVSALLKAGADPQYTIDYEATPFRRDKVPLIVLAANHGPRAEIVVLLLKAGSRPDAARTDGWTALHSSAALGYTEILEALLAAGVGVDTPTTNGTTPLLSAIQGRSIAACRLLVRKGANLNIVDKRYGSPLVAAVLHNVQNDRVEIIEFLLAQRADANLANARGDTALHIAANKGDSERRVVELLLVHGADVNARNARGETPLALAQKGGASALANYLVECFVNGRTYIRGACL